MDPAPAELPLALRQQQVAGLEAGGLDIVGDQEVGSRHGSAVDFPPIRIVRAAHVQMLARLQPLAGKDRTRRRSDGGEDRRAVDGLPEAAGRLNCDRARKRIPELGDEPIAVRGGPAEDSHLAERAHRGDGEHLGQRLGPGADDGQDRCLRRRQVLRRQPRRRAGSHPPQPIGLDHGARPPVGRVEETHPEARTGLAVGVGLEAHQAFGGEGCRHRGEDGASRNPTPRLIAGAARGPLAKGGLERRECHVHRQQFFDVRLAQKKRHD